MYNMLLLLSVSAIAIIAGYISHRHLKKTTEELQMMIASNYAYLDNLREEANRTHDALQQLNPQARTSALDDKYNLIASSSSSFAISTGQTYPKILKRSQHR